MIINTVPCNFVDGKCSECGECCGHLLPLSGADIKRLRRYLKKHPVKLQEKEVLVRCDLLNSCPFLAKDRSTERCMIYPARPEICRLYNCYDRRHGKMTGDIKKYKPYNMNLLLKEELSQ